MKQYIEERLEQFDNKFEPFYVKANFGRNKAEQFQKETIIGLLEKMKERLESEISYLDEHKRGENGCGGAQIYPSPYYSRPNQYWC